MNLYSWKLGSELANAVTLRFQVKGLGSVMTYGGYLHSEKVIVGLGCPLEIHSGSGAR